MLPRVSETTFDQPPGQLHVTEGDSEAVLKAGALQNAIFNSANFSSIATDAKGVIQIFNVGAEKMLGYTAAEVMNKITPADISDPGEVIALARALTVELGTPITPGFEALVFKASRGIEDIYELTYIRKDGSRFPAVVSVTALRDAGGGIIGYLLIGTDNTARQQVEEERMKLDQKLRDQHFYTRSLIESNIDALMTTDPRGIITDVNKQTEALTGCTRDELIGAPFKNYFTDSLRAEAGINLVLAEGKVNNYELTVRARDGKLTVVSYNATTFHDRDRSLKGVFVAARDMTDLKRFEQTLQKNVELADASRLKSEFLANMSHELRTPLNNMMILSQLLFENASGNLSGKQIEFARTIHSSGNDLLQLISDILDLSKIESGKMTVEISELRFEELEDHLNSTFIEIAKNKGIEFSVKLSGNLPVGVVTDGQRLLQVLRNLLSNAFKFTERGSVVVTIELAESGWTTDHPVLGKLASALSISIQDSGIGISKESQDLIFEEFRQADGSTSRRYGGTGLGLSISRQIAGILGGEISVKSGLGEGSIFTLFLPEKYSTEPSGTAEALPVSTPAADGDSFKRRAAPRGNPAHDVILDDRRNIGQDERVLLVVEDDAAFARILVNMAREHGFKVLFALNGDSALDVIASHRVSAIILDIRLPDMDGWGILDRLKRDARLRHIPVQVVSADDHWKKSRRLGAITHITKPIDLEALKEAFDKINRYLDREVKKVLYVDPEPAHRQSVTQLLISDDLEIVSVATGDEAQKAVTELDVDCVVIDIGLPDVSGFDIVSQLRQIGMRDLPILIYTGFADPAIREKHAPELATLAASAGAIEVATPERLVDETSMHLHRRHAAVHERPRHAVHSANVPDSFLVNRKVLVVDDDARNIFALTSVLEERQIQVIVADNAREGIELLKATPDLDVVLMDIMMPEMDGYAAMREIRKLPAFADLPIIAVTAKAMKEDRQKCIDAGANDCITKPVNLEQLFSLLRILICDTQDRRIAS